MHQPSTQDDKKPVVFIPTPKTCQQAPNAFEVNIWGQKILLRTFLCGNAKEKWKGGSADVIVTRVETR